MWISLKERKKERSLKIGNGKNVFIILFDIVISKNDAYCIAPELQQCMRILPNQNINLCENLTLMNRKNKYNGKFDCSGEVKQDFLVSCVDTLHTTLPGSVGWPVKGSVPACLGRAARQGHGATARISDPSGRWH